MISFFNVSSFCVTATEAASIFLFAFKIMSTMPQSLHDYPNNYCVCFFFCFPFSLSCFLETGALGKGIVTEEGNIDFRPQP